MKAKKLDLIELLQINYKNLEQCKIEKNQLRFPNSLKINLDTPINWTFSDSTVKYTLTDIYFFMTNYKPNDPSHYYKSIQLIKNQNQENCSKFSYAINTIDFAHSVNIYKLLSQQLEENNPLLKQPKTYITYYVNEKHQQTENDLKNFLTNYQDLKQELKLDQQDTMNKLTTYMQLNRPFIDLKNKQNNNKDFSFCLDIIQGKQSKQTESFSGIQDLISICDQESVLGKILKMNQKQINKINPIVVVPAQFSLGNICLQTADQYFQYGKVLKQVEEEDQTPTCIKTKINILNKEITFDIYSNNLYLVKNNLMDRVVAIFVNGSPYQFENIQSNWGSANVAQLFKKHRGFYLRYNSTVPGSVVKSWNLKHLVLFQNAEYKDIQTWNDFKEQLTKFLLSKV